MKHHFGDDEYEPSDHKGNGASSAGGHTKRGVSGSPNNGKQSTGGDDSVKQAAAVAVYGKLGDNDPAEDDQSYTPIKSLNTFLFDWKIKARVTKKHAKKIWKNSRSEGTLLNVELIDN